MEKERAKEKKEKQKKKKKKKKEEGEEAEEEEGERAEQEKQIRNEREARNWTAAKSPRKGLDDVSCFLFSSILLSKSWENRPEHVSKSVSVASWDHLPRHEGVWWGCWGRLGTC